MYINLILGPDMEPDLVVLSNDSSGSNSEDENEHETENNKMKTEENSLTPPLEQAKSEGEATEESGQDSGDDTDSSGSTSSSSKSSQTSGMYIYVLYCEYLILISIMIKKNIFYIYLIIVSNFL